MNRIIFICGLLIGLVNSSQVTAQCGVLINEVHMNPMNDPTVTQQPGESPQQTTARANAHTNSILDNNEVNEPQDDAEWIELYNASTCESIDISCWVIGGDMSDPTIAPNPAAVNYFAFAFPPGTVIPPLGHIVIGGNAAPNVDYNALTYFNAGNFCSTKRSLLRDSQGWVALYDNTGAPVDAVYWNQTITGIDPTGMPIVSPGNPALISSHPVYANNINIAASCSACNVSRSLPSVKSISPAIREWGGTPEASSNFTLSRIPDGGSWQDHINMTSGNCNNGQCYTLHTAAANKTADETCTGQGSASASASATGLKKEPYTYQWDDPANTTGQNVSNLSAGTYEVKVTDACGCQDSAEVTILSAGSLILDIDSVPATCGNDNGSASVSATGGDGNYTYQWDDPANQNTATASNLGAGTYTVTVTDGTGCTATATTEVLNNSATMTLNMDSTTAKCGANNGTASVTVSGGKSPYQYHWNDPSNQTSVKASGLGAGNYSVTVTDDNGCTATATVTVPGASELAFTVSSEDVTCNGGSDGEASVSVTAGEAPFTYKWTPSSGTDSIETGLSVGTYSVTVKDVNGCSLTENVTITEPSVIKLTKSKNNTTCGQADGSASISATGGVGNFKYLWVPGGETTAAIKNIVAGKYIAIVSDSNNCLDSVEVVIEDKSTLAIDLSAQNVSCPGANDGQAGVIATGGNSPYTYSWSSGDTTSTIDSVFAGIYTVTVTDSMKCTKTDTIEVGTDPGGPTADFSIFPNPAPITDPTVEFSDNSLDAVNWQWSFGDSDSAAVQSPTHIYPSEKGSYPVKLVIENEFGCKDSIVKIVIIEPELILYVPNAFTPNSDGDNDIFYAVADGIEEYDMYIYDRWGLQIFHTNDLSLGWNGKVAEGTFAQEDTYIYVVKFTDFKNRTQRFVGHVTLVR